MSRKLRCVAVAAGLLAAAAPDARAQATFALRAGGALPFGDTLHNAQTGEAAALSDELRFAIPLELEAGLRLDPLWTIGAYVQRGVGAMSRNAPFGLGLCTDTGASCSSARLTRIGIQVLRSFPGGSVTPWVGLGTGYEWLGYDIRDPSGSGSIEYRGWEWLSAQLGVEWTRGSHFGIGPYASLSFGRFGNAKLSSGGQSIDADIGNKSTHGWLQFGLRVRLDP